MTSATAIDAAAAIDRTEAYPPSVLGKGYSNAELKLIKAIWTDTKVVAQSKMQLCIDLYNLKQELDTNDPNAGNGGAKGSVSRFWKAFEEGDLPEYVTGNRPRVAEWLQAAEFAKTRPLSGASDKALLTLTPSTVCNLSRIKHPKAEEIAAHHIEVHDFIGHDAASYLAKADLDDEVLNEIEAWIDSNPTKALVPSVIRKLEAAVSERNRPASTSTVDIEDVLQSIRDDRPRREQQARVDAVKEELSRSDKEKAEKLTERVRKYNKLLIDAHSSIHELLVFLQSVDRIDGTQFLDDMRAIDIMGFVTVKDDLPRLQKVGEDLMAAVKLARSSNPPTGIDMTTFTVDAV